MINQNVFSFDLFQKLKEPDLVMYLVLINVVKVIAKKTQTALI